MNKTHPTGFIECHRFSLAWTSKNGRMLSCLHWGLTLDVHKGCATLLGLVKPEYLLGNVDRQQEKADGQEETIVKGSSPVHNG